MQYRTMIASVPRPRRFVLNRLQDASGVSGTGIVAQGCVFANGKVSLAWCASNNTPNSIAVYDTVDDVEAIHGHGGMTVVQWIDLED